MLNDAMLPYDNNIRLAQNIDTRRGTTKGVSNKLHKVKYLVATTGRLSMGLGRINTKFKVDDVKTADERDIFPKC